MSASLSYRVPRGDWLVGGYVTVAMHVVMVGVAVHSARQLPPPPEPEATEETAIDVTPVVEDLPTLKLGSERPSLRALPDMA
ncbi:MAG: hypothetical protein ACHREM_32820, partial [Polyangiales bacterium]